VILARDVLDNMRNMALQMKAYSEGLRGSVRVGDTPEKGRHRQWRPTPVVSSADALIEGIKTLGAKRVANITPYMKPLTQQVIDYIESENIEATDSISLEVSDNLAVGRLDLENPVGHADRLDISEADAVVLFACVQMPTYLRSRPSGRFGKPVLWASVSTVYRILKTLGLKAQVPNAGHLLSGRF
jgi:maleate isomerase